MLTRIQLNQQDRDILQSISNIDINLRNNYGQNQNAIDSLLEVGKQNAQIYLQRNRLGQKLNPLEENNLFLAVASLQKSIGLDKAPRRIECYDISHLSGKFVYGSMVTFSDGRANKRLYKLFKCPERNNDFENHKEVLARRLQRYLSNPDKIEWQLSDLIIVDGGKGQLSSDYQVLCNFGLQDKITMIGLAKREEEIFFPNHVEFVRNNPSLKLGEQGGVLLQGDAKYLVQRIRDEAHRFAITNNRNSRLKTAQKSKLDEIQGIGPKTKQKILTTFGSYAAFINTIQSNPELVTELIGNKMTNKIANQLHIASRL